MAPFKKTGQSDSAFFSEAAFSVETMNVSRSREMTTELQEE